MKCTSKETRLEHKSVIVVLHQLEPKAEGKKTETKISIFSKKTETKISIFKRELTGSTNKSAWHGNLEELRDLEEAIRDLDEGYFPRAKDEPQSTLNAAEPDLPDFPSPALFAPDTSVRGRTQAQPPDPKDGAILVQLTEDQFRDLTNEANVILSYNKNAAVLTADTFAAWVGMAQRFAKLVNDAFGGRAI